MKPPCLNDPLDIEIKTAPNPWKPTKSRYTAQKPDGEKGISYTMNQIISRDSLDSYGNQNIIAPDKRQ